MVTVNSSSALFHFSASASQNLDEEKCIVLTSYCSSGREEQIIFEALEDLTIHILQRTLKLKSLRTSYSGKDLSNSCVNEDHGIMILCPVDYTDWKYFSGTL